MAGGGDDVYDGMRLLRQLTSSPQFRWHDGGSTEGRRCKVLRPGFERAADAEIERTRNAVRDAR